MGKTSLEVAEKLNKGEEDDDKKYKACEIAGFKGVFKGQHILRQFKNTAFILPLLSSLRR